MKYNKYFETSLYRECNKSRTAKNIETAGRDIRTAIVLSFFVGVVDTILVGFTRGLDSTVLRFIVIVFIGLIGGGLLAKVWAVIARTIQATFKEYLYDIDMLTYKLDAMQNCEEPEKDYELVGNRDE